MPASRKSNPHIIDLDYMLAFIEDSASAWLTYATDGWKRLEYRHAGGYRVSVLNEVVYEGTDGVYRASGIPGSFIC